MSTTGEQAARALVEERAINRVARWRWGVLAALLIWIYHSILWHLAVQWWEDPDFSHGFFVPLFSAYWIWKKRKRLTEVCVNPSWIGLPIILGALVTLIVGVLGAELFLSRSSLLLLLAGILIYFLGWGIFRAVLFPWVFLFLMVPLPKIVYNQITFPLQFLASDLASGLLALLGVPALQEGNVIHLPTITLEVVEACSGIRSLLSLVTLAIIYGYFLDTKLWRRVILVCAAAPIAVVANGLRVMGTGLLGYYWDPQKAEGFFHLFSGWIIFVLSLGLLFLFHGAVRTLSERLTTRKA